LKVGWGAVHGYFWVRSLFSRTLDHDVTSHEYEKEVQKDFNGFNFGYVRQLFVIILRFMYLQLIYFEGHIRG
jgi:hypothetical protein